jgi:hypothetical protein
MNTRFDTSNKAGHTLFFKEHSVRNSHPSKPVGKTLFVLNVPQYYSKVNFTETKLLIVKPFQSSKPHPRLFHQESIQRVFGQAGEVSAVFFQDKPSAGEADKPQYKFFDNFTIEVINAFVLN